MDIDPITAEVMRPLIGQHFRVVAIAEHDVDLTLTDVEVPEPPDTRLSSFTLLFEGPVEVQLAQGTWQLTIESDGSVTIFLVPIGPTSDNDRMRYEAAFSRVLTD